MVRFEEPAGDVEGPTLTSDGRDEPHPVRAARRKVANAESVVRELAAKRKHAKKKARSLRQQCTDLRAALDEMSAGDVDVDDTERASHQLLDLEGKATAAAAQAVTVRERLGRARRDVEAAEDLLADTLAAHVQIPTHEAEGDHQAGGGDEPEPVLLRFGSLDAFVESYVLPNWRHKTSADVRWCGAWWKHAEAITRLEACWEAFEVMRREPAPALSIVWRDHLDIHMAALTREDGTFARCTAEYHQVLPVWANEPPPQGLFAVTAEAEIHSRTTDH